MDVKWVKIDSWHALASEVETKCGRAVLVDENETRDALPAGKSCESCLRIVARETDDASVDAQEKE